MDEYVSRDDLISLFKNWEWAKYSHLKFTYNSDLDCSIRADFIEVKNEFGSKAKRHFDLLTRSKLKSIINELIDEVIKIDYDKYKDQILKTSANKMVYGH